MCSVNYCWCSHSPWPRSRLPLASSHGQAIAALLVHIYPFYGMHTCVGDCSLMPPQALLLQQQRHR
jgi:hypothetical protein